MNDPEEKKKESSWFEALNPADLKAKYDEKMRNFAQSRNVNQKRKRTKKNYGRILWRKRKVF